MGQPPALLRRGSHRSQGRVPRGTHRSGDLKPKQQLHGDAQTIIRQLLRWSCVCLSLKSDFKKPL